jgi:hypothetical protein
MPYLRAYLNAHRVYNQLKSLAWPRGDAVEANNDLVHGDRPRLQALFTCIACPRSWTHMSLPTDTYAPATCTQRLKPVAILPAATSTSFVQLASQNLGGLGGTLSW